jgi:diketogulonate reductase-like aldo/keto reductase
VRENLLDQLIRETVCIRFKVTNEEKAKESFGKLWNNKHDLDGLEMTDLILNDLRKESTEMMQEIFAVIEKYKQKGLLR